MRNKARIEDILNRLKTVWEKYPDLRLGQLILNITRDPALYYVEDDELIAAIETFYK